MFFLIQKEGFMKKLSIMMAILLVGLAFVGCKNDSNNYDRTIESLFSRVKSVSVVNLLATTSNDTEYVYCSSHQRWEETDNTHAQAVNFKLADAVLLWGYLFPNTPSATYSPSIAKMLPVLQSFYDPKYKTSQPQWNIINAPNGSTVYGWYYFSLRRNGVGSYGGTTQTIQSPCWVDYYYF